MEESKSRKQGNRRNNTFHLTSGRSALLIAQNPGYHPAVLPPGPTSYSHSLFISGCLAQ